MAVLTTRYWDPVRRSNDQKLSWPASHKSCQAAWGEEFKARKHVVKMAPVVRPTPITINAVSAWGWVNGRSSMNRRLAIERFLLLTFCTWKCQMATVLCTYKQSGSISTKSKRNPINAEENQQISAESESMTQINMMRCRFCGHEGINNQICFLRWYQTRLACISKCFLYHNSMNWMKSRPNRSQPRR